MIEQSQPTTTTMNGHEIAHPRETLGFAEFKGMLDVYHLGGSSPRERLDALKQQPKESIALFLTDLNARLNGSTDSLMHTKTVSIGETSTIAPEDRYDLFGKLIDKVHTVPDDINPERVGDALALSTVLLHPFSDGNGRTARILGYMYRDGLDGSEAEDQFNELAEPRDIARQRPGSLINGYIPRLGEGANQSDPAQVEHFIDQVLTSESDRIYTGPYGVAELRAPQKVAEEA